MKKSALSDLFPVPQAESAKYLGMHLDARMNWKVHVKMKALQVADKLRQMCWIVGRYAPTNLRSKVTTYIATDLDLRHPTLGMCKTVKQTGDTTQPEQIHDKRGDTLRTRYTANLGHHPPIS